MIKKLSAFLILALACLSLKAQIPYINSISPTKASIGETIQISGSNLPTSNVEVFFGSTKSTSIIANSTLIQANVPAGATFGEISVINTSTGEIVYSNERFTPTFDGSNVSSSELSNLLGDQLTFETSKFQTQDLCDCDFDNDGDVDIIVTAVGSPDLTLYTNTSSISSVSFTTSTISSPTTTNAICRDLDGDGLADLIVNQNSSGIQGKIFVFRNNTTTANSISFEEDFELLIPNDSEGNFRRPGRIASQDLDLDGHPEILVTTEGENIVYIYDNNSDRATDPDVIDFNSTPTAIFATENSGSAGLGGLDVADLNNDGLPEIVASNFTGNGFYIFRNKSLVNNFTFYDPSYHETSSNIRALKIGDLNNDSYNDIVLTNANIGANDIIELFENTTSSMGTEISFGLSNQVLNVSQSWGLDLGDIDGDQDLDILVASFGTNSFYCIINNSTADIVASDFDPVQIVNLNNSRNIKATDVDSDGKVDVIFTNNSSSTRSGNLSVRLNHNCIHTKINPSGTTIFCGDGSEILELNASSTNYSYQWKKNNVIIGGESSGVLMIDNTGSGSYTVEIIDPNGCSIESDATIVQNLSENYEQPIISTGDTSPCAGSDLTISAIVDPDTDTYLWEGPNDFTSTNSPSITISNISSLNSGNYYLTTTSNSGCQKTSTVLTVAVNTLPFVSVNPDGPNFFCDGQTLELNTTSYDSYDYDWKKDGISFVPARTTTSIDIDEPANYAITIFDINCSFTSQEIEITSISPPVSSFTTSDTTICEGVEITYSATSSGASGIPLINVWDFDDTTIQEGDEINYAHAIGGIDYNVSLTAQYEGLDDCAYVPISQSITIISIPSEDDLDLIRSNNSDPTNYEKCEEKSISLSLEELYESYEWMAITELDSSAISNGPTAVVSSEDDISVKLLDDNSCEFFTNIVSVSNYTSGGIDISTSSPNTIEFDDTFGKIVTLETNQENISLTVNNADSPIWTPQEVFEDNTLSTVLATPFKSRELVYVNGVDHLGCQEIDSVTIVTPSITGAKTFTPNGDGINDCWEVSNIRSTDCSVTIFDKKGRHIRQFDFSPEENFDDCVWDGTQSNGNELPSGTYYYVIKCSSKQDQSSGALLLAK